MEPEVPRIQTKASLGGRHAPRSNPTGMLVRGGGTSPSLSLIIHPADTISRMTPDEMSQLALLLGESIFPLL